MNRTILHIDLDAFFCAVEELRDPSLKGKAFAVGGQPGQRGVVASCSYPARRMGVHSAMPMSQAVRICQNLIIIPPDHSKYSEVSKKVMEYLYKITDLVEVMSIDEAYLDVSQSLTSGVEIAEQLQSAINKELNLPCSIGVASNKLVAKIANDYGKSISKTDNPPNKITIVPPGEEASFLMPLSVQALLGVGPKTAERLAEIGVHTIGDLAGVPEIDLKNRFGKYGHEMAQNAHGIDDRPVYTSYSIKSISQETTFAQDVTNEAKVRSTIRELASTVGERLRGEGLFGSTVKIKLRWSDFVTITRQMSLLAPTDQDETIYKAAIVLLEKAWNKKKPIRLIGVGVCNLGQPGPQLTLWSHSTKDEH